MNVIVVFWFFSVISTSMQWTKKIMFDRGLNGTNIYFTQERLHKGTLLLICVTPRHWIPEEKQDRCARNGPGTAVMKDKVVYKQPPSTQNLRQAIKEVWVTEITQEYWQSLESALHPSSHWQQRRTYRILNSSVTDTFWCYQVLNCVVLCFWWNKVI